MVFDHQGSAKQLLGLQTNVLTDAGRSKHGLLRAGVAFQPGSDFLRGYRSRVPG
jgi:hypothetical protein